eukprot:gene18725-20614_t
MGFAKVIFALLAVAVAIVVYYFVKEDVFDIPKINENNWWGEGERKQESDEITPFKFEATQAELNDLNSRLQSTKYFKSLENSSWSYGTRPDAMKELVDYWLNKYSWKVQEKLINSFNHFKTNIDGISLHFIHAKPPNVKQETKVVPLLLLHGWPGSFFEFYKVIPKLLEEKNGMAFELIVPSLPGYGFSSAARKKGMHAANVALLMKKLMHRLGHSTFYIQGGDWGSVVTRGMAILFPSVVRGAHMNFWPMMAHPKYPILASIIGTIAPSLVLPDKKERDNIFPLMKTLKFALEETGYLHIQSTKPDTVGFAMINTPTGLASYILEKFVAATFSSGDNALQKMEKRLTLDEILTNIMIYWLTDSMPTAMRLYKEGIHSPYLNIETKVQITVPVGFAAYHEFVTPPKQWLKHACKNLVSYTRMDFGGHFAAFEAPDSFSQDVRSFVEKVEASSTKQ